MSLARKKNCKEMKMVVMAVCSDLMECCVLCMCFFWLALHWPSVKVATSGIKIYSLVLNC
jgi:hypothetical protein